MGGSYESGRQWRHIHIYISISEDEESVMKVETRGVEVDGFADDLSAADGVQMAEPSWLGPTILQRMALM